MAAAARLAPSLWAAGVGAGLLLQALHAAEDEHKALAVIRGSMQLHGRPADIEAKPFLWADYEIHFDGINSKVRLIYEYRSETNSGPREIEYCIRDDSVYTIVSWDARATVREDLPKSLAGKIDMQVERQGGRVYSSSYPKDLLPRRIAPWIAYCSGHLLAGQATNLMPNPFPFAAAPAERLRFEWTSEGSPPFLFPASLDIYKPGVRIKQGHSTRTKQGAPVRTGEEVLPLDPPFDQGYLGLRHRVFSWTEVGGYHFPRQFEQTYFYLRPANPTWKVEISQIIRGETETIELHPPREVPLPVPRDEANISERRPSLRPYPGPPVFYNFGEHGWLDPDDPESMRIARDVRERIAEQSREARQIRKPFHRLGAVIVVLALALPILIWRMFRE